MNVGLEPIGPSAILVVYLFYGLAFLVLGLSILLLPKEGLSSKLLPSLWLLAAFGIVHGALEWLVLWAAFYGPGEHFTAAQNVLLAVSFGFLFEFGRRLIRSSEGLSSFRRALNRAVGPWIYAAPSTGLVLGYLSDPVSGLGIASRYFVGFPAALLASVGLLLCARTEGRCISVARVRVPFYSAAGAFVVYGVVGGLVPRAGDLFPSGILNEATFAAVTGIPVQIVRAGCALSIFITVTAILRIYQFEVRRRLGSALDHAQSSLVRIGRLSDRNKLILEATGQGLFGLDREGKTTFVNRMAAEMLGRSMEEMIGKTHHAIVHGTRPDGSFLPRDECPILAAMRNGRTYRGVGELFWRKDGSSFEVEFISTPVREEGLVVGTVVSFRDITELREAERHLRQAALVVEQMPEGVVITDSRGRIESVNPAFEAETGYRREEIVGKSPRLLRSPHHDKAYYRRIGSQLRERGRWQGEIWIRRKNGEIHPEWISINALRDRHGRVTNHIGILSDIETHREVRQRLHRLAYYDGLTGLPNRELFRDRLDLALAQARRSGEMVAVMFIDLDHFKHVNDTLGHRTGDRILRAVARQIHGAVRESDTLARVGGDEFTVILPGLQGPLAAGGVARKILDALQQPFTIEGHSFYITASIGISTYPADGRRLESLTRKADIAMYRAKELGRSNYQMYQRQLATRFRRRVALETELRRALDRDELYLVYQPLIDLKSGRWVGVEALARWRHPRLGEVPPATFIPVAEESELIDRVGAWALTAACRDARSWTAEWPQGFRVAVNVSARQLQRGDFQAVVSEILDRSALPPQALALELTESVLIDHSTSNESVLRALSEMGVEITIDDFGTGYSSLGYLKRFAVDKLKIDESFMRDIPGDPNDRALASMIIAVAHASGMRVTAEGVENPEQLEFLRRQNCDEVQGFLVGKPLSARGVAGMRLERQRLPKGKESSAP